jgi:hypothetical protein
VRAGMKPCPKCGKLCPRIIGGKDIYYCLTDSIYFDDAGEVLKK